MQFTITQSALLPELARLQSVAEQKSTIPILGNILLEVDGDGLHLSATNLDTALQTQAGIGMLSTPGAACLPGRKLFEIVKNLPNDAELSFAFGEQQCEIKAGRSRFKLGTMPKDAFPEIKAAPDSWLSMPGGVWQAMTDRVLFAATQEESRYALSSIRVEIGNGKLRMIATDGHRLAFVETNGEYGDKQELLIPKRAMLESARLCDGQKEIGFSIGSDSAFWKAGKRILSSRLGSGEFPKYELVLPKENKCVVTIDRELLLNSVRRVSLMADERSHTVKMVIKDRMVEIMAQSSESGEAVDAVSAEYEEAEITVGFNGNYICEALNAIQTKDVALRFKDGNSQMEINPVGESSMIYRSIVMPCKL